MRKALNGNDKQKVVTKTQTAKTLTPYWRNKLLYVHVHVDQILQ